MRFFSLYDFQNVVLLSFLGCIVLVLLYMAFGKLGAAGPLDENSNGNAGTEKPIPLILIFVYVSFVIWAFVYVLFVGIRGNPF